MTEKRYLKLWQVVDSKLIRRKMKATDQYKISQCSETPEQAIAIAIEKEIERHNRMIEHLKSL